MITTDCQLLNDGLWMALLNIQDSTSQERLSAFKVIGDNGWAKTTVNSHTVGITETPRCGFDNSNDAREAAMKCRVRADGYR